MQTDTTERPTPTRDRDEAPPNPADRAADEAASTGETSAGEKSAGDEMPPAAAPAWFRNRKDNGERPEPEATNAPQADETPAVPAFVDVTSPRNDDAPKLKPPTRRRPPLVVPQSPEEPTEPVDWRHRTLLWLTGFAATGYGLSLLVHLLFLGTLGLFVIDLSQYGPVGATLLGFTEDDGEGFDFGANDSLHQEAGGQDSAEEQVEPIEVSQILQSEVDAEKRAQEQVERTVASAIPSTGSGEGVDDGDGSTEQSGGGRKIGSNAVQSNDGTFTVVVTPVRPLATGESAEGFDPEPNEPYHTYIYIAVPDDVEELGFADIEGRIVGTDGWETNIPYDTSRTIRSGGQIWKVGTSTYFYNPKSRGVDFTPVNERHVSGNRNIPIAMRTVNGKRQRYAVLRLVIPAAGQQGIKDTIHIECKPLNKEATLEVVF